MAENNNWSFPVTVKNPETGEEREVIITQVTPEKGRGKDNPKLMPQNFETLSVKDIIDLWGESRVNKLLKGKLRQVFAAFTAEATTKTVTGPDGKEKEETETDRNIVQKDYSEMFANLSQRGETLQSLSRRLNEIEGTELPAVIERLLGGEVDPTSPEFLDLRKLAASLKEERAEIKASIEAKKRKKDVDDAEAPAAAAA